MLNDILLTAIQLALALCLDRIFGEVQRFHPLVGFGTLASCIEQRCNHSSSSKATGYAAGIACVLLLVMPLPIFIAWLASDHVSYWLLEIALLYWVIGQKSLADHGMQVYRPLHQGDIEQARLFTGYLVSRDTSQLNEMQMQRATTESMLENGHDASIASLAYFIIGGAPLAVLHRLANTLDAMWGYKNQRFTHFGWAAARLDDLLGLFSAIVTSLLYLSVKQSKAPYWRGLRLAWQQSQRYKSKNGGMCMATGAFALGIKLGGSADYHGRASRFVRLGLGRSISNEDIPASIKLVKKSAGLLIALTALVGLYEQLAL